MRVRAAFCLVYEARLSDCARNAEHGPSCGSEGSPRLSSTHISRREERAFGSNGSHWESCGYGYLVGNAAELTHRHFQGESVILSGITFGFMR
jgi:hypothetical protein